MINVNAGDECDMPTVTLSLGLRYEPLTHAIGFTNLTNNNNNIPLLGGGEGDFTNSPDSSETTIT